MSKTLVLLKKKSIRGTSKSRWTFILDGMEFETICDGDLHNQLNDAVDAIKGISDAEDNLLVASPLLLPDVTELIQELHPNVQFVRVCGPVLGDTFKRAYGMPNTRRGSGKTLFICSDASSRSGFSTWAWCVFAAPGSYDMGVCAMDDTNVAELEGVLRGLIANKGTDYENIHLYSDSKNAVEFFDTVIVNGGTLPLLAAAELDDVIEEAREIVRGKTVTIEWVRGHRAHRMNQAADQISRVARQAVVRGEDIETIRPETDAMFAVFYTAG